MYYILKEKATILNTRYKILNTHMESPSKKKKIMAGAAILSSIIILMILDASIVEKELVAQIWSQEEITEEINNQSSNSSNITSLPAGGVQKLSGPDVLKLLKALEFDEKPLKGKTIIEQIIPKEVAETNSRILLKNGDRAGSISWVETLQVKTYFLAVKDALHTVFSPNLRDLVHEPQQRDGRPTRNLLTFFDPMLSEERIVFVRVRERLYELRISDGMDEEIFALVEKLTE
ncbi:MAG: hypothetical protein KAS32_25475 [Candidatus Peribacteraceae bacterium]|nr:hypothetical protein [Candidatus Peribacteraceae bacterium]